VARGGGLMLPHPGTPRFLTLILSSPGSAPRSPRRPTPDPRPFAFSVVRRAFQLGERVPENLPIPPRG